MTVFIVGIATAMFGIVSLSFEPIVVGLIFALWGVGYMIKRGDI